LTADVSLASAARELNIREHHQAGDVAICQDAAVGNPVAAGAFERRTPFLAAIPVFKGGNVMARRWWFFIEGCQGNKRHRGFSFLQPLLEPKDSFPISVFFHLLRINDMLSLPLPVETTTEAGRCVSQRLQDDF